MRSMICALVCVSVVGCSAIRTEMWSRDQQDYLHPDCESPLKGIPVMLKVPSHIEVIIRETLYAKHNEGHLRVVELDKPDLSVDANLKYTEKMFLVDPVRVGAGSGAYGFGFNNQNVSKIKNANNQTGDGHGYLHSSSYKAVDNTITQSASLLSSVLSFASPSARKSSVDADFGLEKITRTVAYHRFDLGSPTVDEEVFAFLHEKMNQCHGCGLGQAAPYSSVITSEAVPVEASAEAAAPAAAAELAPAAASDSDSQ